MHCLRCGRETQEDHVFCDLCRNQMKKYPVRPGTAVMLPRRKETAAPKKTKRHAPPKPAELIKKLRRQRRGLRITVFCLVVLLAAVAAALVYVTKKEVVRPGQNYSAVTETTVPTT